MHSFTELLLQLAEANGSVHFTSGYNQVTHLSLFNSTPGQHVSMFFWGIYYVADQTIDKVFCAQGYV